MQSLVEITQKLGSDGISYTLTRIFPESGNNTVIVVPSAPARRIVVTAFVIQNMEAQTPVMMILRSGNSENGWRFLAATEGTFLSKEFAPGHGWMLNQDEPLILNLSVAAVCNCSVQYYYVNY